MISECWVTCPDLASLVVPRQATEATMEGAGLYQIGFVTLPTKAQRSLKFLVFSPDLSRGPHSESLRNFIWQLLSKPFDCPRMEILPSHKFASIWKIPVGWFGGDCVCYQQWRSGMADAAAILGSSQSRLETVPDHNLNWEISTQSQHRHLWSICWFGGGELRLPFWEPV